MSKLYNDLMSRAIDTIMVHSGKFHADDVFSVALCTYVNPKIQYKRVAKVPENIRENTLVADIGGGKYDHHQPDAEWRSEEDGGIKYAAFGLLWREIGTDILREKDAKDFDQNFVSIIDNTDNTGIPNLISSQISAFNKNWDEVFDYENEGFDRAVSFALEILDRNFKRYISSASAESVVLKAIDNQQNKNVLVLDQFVPTGNIVDQVNKERLEADKITFIIYPSARNKYEWNAMTVKKDINSDSQEPICPFPEEWAGKRDEDIKIKMYLD